MYDCVKACVCKYISVHIVVCKWRKMLCVYECVSIFSSLSIHSRCPVAPLCSTQPHNISFKYSYLPTTTKCTHTKQIFVFQGIVAQGKAVLREQCWFVYVYNITVQGYAMKHHRNLSLSQAGLHVI